MAQRSLGRITFDGAPKRATDAQDDPTAQRAAKSFRVQQISTNTNEVLVGDAGINPVTLDGVFAIIEPPNPTNISPFYETPNAIYHSDTTDMAQVYLCGAVGESVLISYVE